MRVFMLAFILLLVPACQPGTTYQKSFKILSSTKITAETLVATAKRAHMDGLLDNEQIVRIEVAYNSIQQVQQAFIVAQSSLIFGTGESTPEQTANIALSYWKVQTTFIDILIEYGLLQANSPAIQIIGAL